MRWRDFFDDLLLFFSIVVAVAALAFSLGLSGCAGHEAMVWKQPKPAPCGMVVCEHRGPGRMDYKRDCFCSGKQPSEVFRDLGI